MAPSAQTTRKAQALDDLIMATNSSSIASKRSVERLYYPDEPHYFRFFVKKFQRRAPLINRGYHLRLKVIDTLVRRFLEKPSALKKVVINLGCGSDVLPWQCEARYPEACRDVTFVDVDYPDLIQKKCRVVLDTPELQNILAPWEVSEDSAITLKSQKYCQVGCDLRQLPTLQRCLSMLFDMSRTEFFLVAEVSITYMDTDGADDVIKWASALGNAEFCLLEQILPDGPDHPFAHTMLKHFNKLNTPLKSVNRYPNVASQVNRFETLGWPCVQSWTLWEAWADNIFMTSAERQALDIVEPFDEWEEFALFASHYLVVLASTPDRGGNGHLSQKIGNIDLPSYQTSISVAVYEQNRGYRRFGAAMLLENPEGQTLISHSLGQGPNGRLNSEDLYQTSFQRPPKACSKRGPPARVCHTLTDLGNAGVLLVGGRTSPSTAFKDCWLYRKIFNTWDRIQDLPVALFRHSVTRLGSSALALLAGGRLNHFQTSCDYFLFNPVTAWTKCRVRYPPPALYGASFICTCCTDSEAFSGLLTGGLLEDGLVNQRTYKWTLDISGPEPLIIFDQDNEQDEDQDKELETRILSRFGSTIVQYDGNILLVGGVIKDIQLPAAYDILLLKARKAKLDTMAKIECENNHGVLRPFFIGSSVVRHGVGDFAILGGGATCFSMGTYWSPGSYSFNIDVSQSPGHDELQRSLSEAKPLRYLETFEITANDTSPSLDLLAPVELQIIPRVKIDSKEQFHKILDASKPVIIEGFDVGSCTSTWTSEYLVNIVGAGRQISVHESTTEKMDFNAKNFRYVTKSFGDFMKEVQDGKRLYLRALSKGEPSGVPTQLEDDYPSLAKDFVLPPQLCYIQENTFSSVLRISGPVNMWLHYDVMANVYVQIGGSKRFVLFPPSDVSHLSFSPGASSSSIDVFSSLDSGTLRTVHPHEAIVQQGDILFLPPLWLHTAKPMSNVTIAVNVFFRNLDKGYSAGRDVYGNRDLAAYEKGRQDIARIGRSFSKLPPDVRGFYVRRLADELLQSITNM